MQVRFKIKIKQQYKFDARPFLYKKITNFLLA